MKILTLYSIGAAIFLPGLLLSSDPAPQKVVAVAIFCFHVGLVHFTWGNFDTDATDLFSKKRVGLLLIFACYVSGVLAFIAAISAIDDPWSLSNLISR